MDLCSIERMRKLLENTSFMGKYYTAEERDYISARGKVGAESAAAMFAAKEAFLKALGCGIGGGITLCEIGIHHAPNGAPSYELSGEALRRIQEMGCKAFLSLTHEADTACAVCVLD